MDAGFSVGKANSRQVVAHARAAMKRLAWTYDPQESNGGQWSWSRQVNGEIASASLQADMYGDPRSWSLHAGAPAVLRPVSGC